MKGGVALWIRWCFRLKEAVGGWKSHFPKVDLDDSSAFPSKPPQSRALDSSLHSLIIVSDPFDSGFYFSIVFMVKIGLPATCDPITGTYIIVTAICTN